MTYQFPVNRSEIETGHTFTAHDQIIIAAMQAQTLITDLMNGVERSAHQEVLNALEAAINRLQAAA